MLLALTSLLPALLAAVLGVVLAMRGRGRFGLARPLQGLLIVFALGYLVGVLNAHFYWRTYWPGTPWAHTFGPDWPADLLWGAVAELRLTGPLFVAAFLMTVLLQRSKAS